jgi:hypothetical protein
MHVNHVQKSMLYLISEWVLPPGKILAATLFAAAILMTQKTILKWKGGFSSKFFPPNPICNFEGLKEPQEHLQNQLLKSAKMYHIAGEIIPCQIFWVG